MSHMHKSSLGQIAVSRYVLIPFFHWFIPCFLHFVSPSSLFPVIRQNSYYGKRTLAFSREIVHSHNKT